jgi:hypothetical protein
MAAAEQATVSPAEPRVETGPFKFLDFFADTPEDRRRFGGREREIRELVARIVNEWTLVLYGRSGIGKTSLLLAGVFPELETRGYRAVYARTLTDPIRDLCRAVGDKCGRGGPEEDLRSAVEQAVAGGPLVIVLDQFEEFFIRFREKPETRAAFIEAVGSLVNDRSLDVTVVFSLREDWLAALDDFREKIPALFQNQYRLRPLTAFGVRQAISRPLTDAGIPSDDAVVSRLVDQLEDSGFDPPVLQIICSELYSAAVERASGGVPRITLDDVQKVGDLDDIFRRCLDGLGEAIPSNQTLLARMILDALITGDNTKQAVTLKDLLSSQFSAQEEEVREILDILVQQRLLRQQIRDGEPWYELIHERLVPHLKKWLDSDQRFHEFRQARDFVETNCKSDLWLYNPEALLNSGVLTDLLGPYKERFRFQKRELEFIFHSAVYRHSPDVSFWAERRGLKEAITILLKITASPNDQERNGAAIAAGRFTDLGSRLAPACLWLAMKDPTETVRRSAGLSLSRLARKTELLVLRSALGRKATRRAALETLTDLWLGGNPLKELSWLSRRFAREEAERRRQAEYQELIRARRKVGAVQGLLASLSWMLLVGVPLTTFGIGLSGVETNKELYQRMATALGAMLPAAAVFGALLGGVSASAVAREAATGKSWVRALLGSRPLFYGTGVLAALGVGLYGLANGEEKNLWLLGMVLAFVVSAPLSVFLASGLGVFRAAVYSPNSRPRLWLWSFLAALGSSGFAFAVLSLWLYVTSSKNPIDRGWAKDFGLALCIGLAFCISLIAITSSEYKHPIRHLAEPSIRRRRWSRIGSTMGALTAVLGIGYSLCPNMIPLFASQEIYDPSTGLRHSQVLGPRFPDTRYFQICNSADFAQFASVVRVPFGASINLGPQTDQRADENKALLDTYLSVRKEVLVREAFSRHSNYDKEILLLPPGCHLGSFRMKSRVSIGRKAMFSLSPLPDLQAVGGELRLSKGDIVMAPLVIRCPPTKSRPCVGFIEGNLPESKSPSARWLMVYPLWYKLSDVTVVTQDPIYILGSNENSNKEDTVRVVKLSPLPRHPISISLWKSENLFLVIPDSLGQWKIGFRVQGVVPRPHHPVEKVTIPVLLQLVDVGYLDRERQARLMALIEQ